MLSRADLSVEQPDFGLGSKILAQKFSLKYGKWGKEDLIMLVGGPLILNET